MGGLQMPRESVVQGKTMPGQYEVQRGTTKERRRGKSDKLYVRQNKKIQIGAFVEELENRSRKETFLSTVKG